ncbi:hypothetical protein T439DRAFT_320160 [Meredithblackwellia eburnea MCA 4105]
MPLSPAVCFIVTGASIFFTFLGGIIGSVPYGCRINSATKGTTCSSNLISAMMGTGVFFAGLGTFLMYGTLAVWTLFAVQRVSRENALSRDPNSVPPTVATAVALLLRLITFLLNTAVSAKPLSGRLVVQTYYRSYLVITILSFVSTCAFTWAIVAWTTFLADSAIAEKAKILAAASSSQAGGPGQVQNPFRGQAEIPAPMGDEK